MTQIGSITPFPPATGRTILRTVDSTMTEIKRQATNLTAPHWIMAHDQTAGTGRRGRVWESRPGNFYSSVFLRPGDPPERLALRSFVASLALFDALSAVTGRPDLFALKWPNDVLLGGAKLAGILLETLPEPGGPALIIGIGVNLAHAPEPEVLEPGANPPTSLLGNASVKVRPEDFLSHLAAAFDTRETALRTFGFDPIRRAWLDRAAYLGQTITARTGGARIEGRFETVDDTGALVLDTDQGRRTIASADVFFNER